MTPREAEKLEALAQDGWSSSIETNSQSAKWTERKAGFEAPLQMEEVAAKSLARTGEVVDKGFSGRPGAVNLAEELVLEFVHLGSTEDTMTVLLEGSKNKMPKALPLCVSSIFSVLPGVRAATVPMAAVKKELKALCKSTVNNVRPNAVKLMGEMYRWRGPTLVQDIIATSSSGRRPYLAAIFGHMSVVKTPQTQFECLEFVGEFGVSTCKPHGVIEYVKEPFGLASRLSSNAAKIPKELLADMANEHDKVAWKKRLGAMEQTQQILTRRALSANMKTKAVHVMGVVVASVGPSVAKLAKLVGSKLVVGVADNKNAMQQACLDSLRNWVVHGDMSAAS
ncbi:hypothetical protein DYB28_006153 [Aphanomyces astaci]|uniref:XMAP215/Dis1/CLASP TOG domain-containing protein n=1 Tax=Aphanomyces astaci TaxID=112090 RepID=A0A9X8H497_APHAT|nr:hypothetical protein DYB28_006153 [Aphanomyces astaci]